MIDPMVCHISAPNMISDAELNLEKSEPIHKNLIGQTILFDAVTEPRKNSFILVKEHLSPFPYFSPERESHEQFIPYKA
jgi:hypothetical protein